MKDDNKTKEQLMDELAQARRHIVELEESASKSKQSEDALSESAEKYRIHFSRQ